MRYERQDGRIKMKKRAVSSSETAHLFCCPCVRRRRGTDRAKAPADGRLTAARRHQSPDVLFKEAQTLDDGSFFGVALADAEEADDLYDKEDNGADAGGDPADDRDYRAHYRDQDRNDRDLKPLTDVEHRIGGGLRGEKGYDDADPAHDIREHGEDLIFGDVLRVELGGMIGGIIRLRLILLLLIGIIGKLTAAAPADHGVVVV